jgi:5-methyltetrahydrofolate--homocysteine methyltransferase
MSFDTHGRTFSGCDAVSVALTLTALGADAIGVNCSLGPLEIYPILKEISQHTSLPLIAKPNAGLPKIAGEKTVFDITAEQFAHDMTDFAKMGVCILGGCCGTDPEFISLTKKQAQSAYIKRTNPLPKSAICSGSKTIFIDNVAVIGERINPTGKKALKQALINNDIGYILKQAAEQVNAGADILDINVGIPDIDQKQIITHIIKAVQGITNAPLQIDSNDPEVIEAALRVYNGKAIVNSVTGEAHSLNAILPIIKKYGAAVVGLALDDGGIPSSYQGRFDAAKKIISSAAKYGIPKEDIYIDCLALTISADSSSAVKTLQAIEKVSQKLGVKTILGVSNISFGLPERKNINNTFLSMALKAGLNLPIVNPNAEGVMDIIYSYKALAGIDESCKNYIARFADAKNDKPAVSVKKEDESLEYLILNGIKDGVEAQVQKLLDTSDGMKIIDERLIPILDKVGLMYESAKIFLPQLISSSEAAKAAFDYLNSKLNKDRLKADGNKQIILATVKGDVHDIGKNIVKVVLQNYGFDVIDLGYDTDIDLVVSTALKTGAKLVGLSALMTTTLKSMEQTITALYKNGYNGEVMVGGAVLDEEYSKKIKATYYAKNAQEAANIARSSLARYN